MEFVTTTPAALFESQDWGCGLVFPDKRARSKNGMNALNIAYIKKWHGILYFIFYS
jgi:hypothetical protein